MSWAWLEVVVLAFALALDAAAVCAALGAAGATVSTLGGAALLFGLAQAGMAGAGASGGAWLAAAVAPWHIALAGVLLGVVGGRMLWGGEDAGPASAAPGLAALVALALATSIDALVAGLSLPLLGPSVALAVAMVGVVTALLSGLAAAAGRRAGALLGARAPQVAGGVLVLLGVRVLVGGL